MTRRFARYAAVAAILAAAPLVLTGGGALAQSADDIINALRSKETRGVPAAAGQPQAPSAEEQAFIEALRSKASRGLSVGEADRPKLAKVITERPAIDLEINFDFNSASISDKVRPVVMTLGKALQASDLKGKTFVVAGHTDAKGRAPYNQQLSEKRAAAVKDYLMNHFNITADQLVVVGYGSERLKTPKAPYADENRRVEVVNMSSSVAGAP